MAYRFEDPGDSSSNEFTRPFPCVPKVLKRANLDVDFSRSIVLRRSLAFSTSVRLIRRNAPASAGPVPSGLGVVSAAATSSSALLVDFRRPVKRPRPGFPILPVPRVPSVNGIAQRPDGLSGDAETNHARSVAARWRKERRCWLGRHDGGAARGCGSGRSECGGRSSNGH